MGYCWTNSIQGVKEKVDRDPCPRIPHKKGRIYFRYHISHYHIAGILSQIQDGKEKVIAYTELKYCMTRKELLAVFTFVKQFKHFLLGRTFRIRTK